MSQRAIVLSSLGKKEEGSARMVEEVEGRNPPRKDKPPFSGCYLPREVYL
jgi:hypothetical protein